jgi:hypothetical protein
VAIVVSGVGERVADAECCVEGCTGDLPIRPAESGVSADRRDLYRPVALCLVDGKMGYAAHRVPGECHGVEADGGGGRVGLRRFSPGEFVHGVHRRDGEWVLAPDEALNVLSESGTGIVPVVSSDPFEVEVSGGAPSIL